MPSASVFNFNGAQMDGPDTVPIMGEVLAGNGSNGTRSMRLRKWQTAHRHVGFKTDLNVQGSSNGTTDLSATFSYKDTAKVDLVGCRVVFQNFKNAGLPGDNAYTIGSCVWDGAGVNQRTRITFGGSISVTVQPGATVVSDPIGCWIPKGGGFNIYTYISVSSGQTFPLNYLHQATVDGNNLPSRSGAGTDITLSATPSAVPGNSPGFGPSAVIGLCSFYTPVLCGLGDSKMLGAGEVTNSQLMGAYYRAANSSGYPWMRIAQSGQTMQNWAIALTARCPGSVLALAGVSDFFVNLGVNDIYLNARTLSQLQGNAISLWTFLAALDARVWQSLCEPVTTSTDSWRTAANQTYYTGFGPGSTWDNWNLWLIDGAPMLSGAAVATGSNAAGTVRMGAAGHPASGYVDILTPIQDAGNPGKWKTDGSAQTFTSDGIHPTTAGHTLQQPNYAAKFSALTYL